MIKWLKDVVSWPFYAAFVWVGMILGMVTVDMSADVTLMPKDKD